MSDGDPCRGVRERFSPARAALAQERMRSLLILEGNPRPAVVGGLDVAYRRVTGGLTIGYGVALAMEWGSWRVLDCRVAVGPVCVPYIPGLLAFREMQVLAPAVAALRRSLGRMPDLIVADGHGIAHPRGFGIASHVGVAFDTPSIGVAKKRLVGREVEEDGRRYLVHGGTRVAVVLGRGSRRIYVSPGHRVSLDAAAGLVEEMLSPGSRLPAPTAEADRASKAAKALLRPAPEIRVARCPQPLLPPSSQGQTRSHTRR